MATTALTIIKVCKDVPLDSTYSDTIKFASEGAQSAFFTGKAKYTFPNCSYQRVSNMIRGGGFTPRIAYSTRVDRVADDLYDCNYVMFQNSAYGAKWFYGFIRHVNYINPECTEIIYEIDYFQTYLFDFEILPSMVIREHTKTDGLYEHLEPEPFGEMDMIVDATYTKELSEGAYIVVGVNATPDDNTVAGAMYDGVYSGVEIHEFTSASAATSFIRTYDNKAKSAAIQCVYMSPWSVQGTTASSINVPLPASLGGGYVPRNKKLLSYPFIKLSTSNRQGEMKDFYFEYFSQFGGNAPPQPLPPVFLFYVKGGLTPTAYCYTTNYRNNRNQESWENIISVGGFPACIWSSNAYMNWESGQFEARALQIGVNTIIGMLSNSIGAAAAFVGGHGGSRPMETGIDQLLKTSNGNNFDTLASGAAQLINLGIEGSLRKKCPGLTHGSIHDVALNFAQRKVGFDVYKMSITAEMAASIDDYFDMFGYAVNRIKVPEMEGRNAWNYVQTQNIIIKGSMPVQAMDLIKSCFNRGIRLWHNGDWVGDYSKPNYPV